MEKECENYLVFFSWSLLDVKKTYKQTHSHTPSINEHEKKNVLQNVRLLICGYKTQNSKQNRLETVVDVCAEKKTHADKIVCALMFHKMLVTGLSTNSTSKQNFM